MADAKIQLREMLQGTLAANPKEAVFMLALGREAAEALATDEPQGTWLDRLTAEREALGRRLLALETALEKPPEGALDDAASELLLRHQCRLMKSLHETLSARLRLAGEILAEETRTDLRYTTDEVEGMLKERTTALLQERDAAVQRGDKLFAQVKARDEKLDAVYSERNALAVALAKMALKAGFVAGRGVDRDPPDGWDPDWLNVVYVELPGVGQVSWHIGPRDLERLIGLPDYPGEWDGTAHGRDPSWPDRIEFRAIRTIDKESIRQQAAAWEEVWATLCKAVPGFTRAGKTGEECACNAIRELAARVPRDVVVAYVLARDAMHEAERGVGGFVPSRLHHRDPVVVAYREAKAAMDVEAATPVPGGPSHG